MSNITYWEALDALTESCCNLSFLLGIKSTCLHKNSFIEKSIKKEIREASKAVRQLNKLAVENDEQPIDVKTFLRTIICGEPSSDKIAILIETTNRCRAEQSIIPPVEIRRELLRA